MEYQWSKLSGNEATLALVKGQNDTSFGSWSGAVGSYDDIVSSVSKITVRSYASDDEYTVKVDVGVGSGTNVANRLIFYSQPFQLSGGKIPESIQFPGELEVTVTEPVTADQTHSTVAVWAPSVRWVEYGFTFPGLTLNPNLTHNGWATNCWASELFGNGYIYIDGGVLSGRRLKWVQAVDGPDAGEYVTLWYDEARTVGERWDIGTGQWTSIAPLALEPKLVLPRISASSVAVGATNCEPGRAYTILEHSGVGDAGVVIGTIYASSEGRVALYTRFQPDIPAKFFSIRLATDSEVGSAKPAVPSGASFP
jgi:hypothetical protein